MGGILFEYYHLGGILLIFCYPSATPGLSGMSGIALLIALILMIFSLTMRDFFHEAHGAMCSLMWHKDQNLFVISLWHCDRALDMMTDSSS